MHNLITSAERVGMAIASLCLLIIMFLVGADAVLRYAFAAPIPWSIELVSYYLMVMAAYLAAADTLRRGDHIHLDLFQSRMGPRTKAWTAFLHSILAALVFAIIAYGSAWSMLDAYRHHEYIHGYIAWPVWLSFLPIVLGSMLLTLRLTLQALALIQPGAESTGALHKEA